MKVPKGKTVYDSGKKYGPGDELPDAVAQRHKLEKAPALKAAKRTPPDAGEAGKPSVR